MNTIFLYLVVTICYADGLDCYKNVPERFQAHNTAEANQDVIACNNIGLAHYQKTESDGSVWTFECLRPELEAQDTTPNLSELSGDYELDESEVTDLGVGYEDGDGWAQNDL